MTWKYEILRCLFVAFGFFELFTNFTYLTKSNGITLARRQHQELPATITDKQMKVKVICMFTTGLIFFVAGILSCLLHKQLPLLYLLVSILLSVYALIEAMYYKYRNTFGFFAVTLILLVLILLP